jgi:hypothetical protein
LSATDAAVGAGAAAQLAANAGRATSCARTRAGGRRKRAKITRGILAGDEVHLHRSASWVGDGMGCGNLKLLGRHLLRDRRIGKLRDAASAGPRRSSWERWPCFVIPGRSPRQAQGAIRSRRCASRGTWPDPAGGFKLLKTIVYALVPSSLFASQKEQIEKTLSLSEKYCIISKIAKTAMPLEVVIEEI